MKHTSKKIIVTPQRSPYIQWSTRRTREIPLHSCPSTCVLSILVIKKLQAECVTVAVRYDQAPDHFFRNLSLYSEWCPRGYVSSKSFIGVR